MPIFGGREDSKVLNIVGKKGIKLMFFSGPGLFSPLSSILVCPKKRYFPNKEGRERGEAGEGGGKEVEGGREGKGEERREGKEKETPPHHHQQHKNLIIQDH